MSYEIKKTDGTTIVSLADGVNDSSSASITFIGKNVSNFGKIQNENFLHLLENFASNTEPPNKLRGQVWYDTDNRLLKIHNGGDGDNGWPFLAPLHYEGVEPTASHQGYFWFSTSTNQLYINRGTTENDFLLIGPENTPGYGDTRFSSTTLTDIYGGTHPVIKALIGDETVGVITKSAFAINSSNSIDGMTVLSRGLNFKNPTTNDFVLNGRSLYANLSTTATNIEAGAAGSVPYQASTGITTFVSIGANNSVLLSNGSTPSWQSLSALTIANATTATNLAGGVQGSIPYQTAQGNTTFVGLGTSGYILTASATRPVWSNPQTLTIAYSNTATHAISADNAVAAVTQAVTDNSTKVATTEFVHSILPTGIILMWSGSILYIPTGWHLCDGTSGTPDLRGKFIIGANDTTLIYGAQGGTSTPSITVAAAGDHNHGGLVDGHTLDSTEMPNHGHLLDDISYMESNGSTTYNDPMLGTITISSREGSGRTDYDNGAIFQTHGTYKTGGTDGVTQPHRHGIGASGTHIHTATIDNSLPPYYALCYIMKIS